METIAAIATPPGRGAIAIVRCSGPDARRIAGRVFRSREPLHDRVMTYGTVVDLDGVPIDRGLAVAMDAPATATGEELVELHVHGSPVAARETLRALLHAGARIAEPGEFTKRAYLNGKLDLSAAEAVADLIDAETRAGVRAAAANLAGALSTEVRSIRRTLDALLEELAGAIDYPDEVPDPDPRRLAAALRDVRTSLEALRDDWERGRVVREGVSLAIVGPPNVGKSSLLNALLGDDRAIVSPHPGTTRDVIEDRFIAGGAVVRVMDTAGIRAAADPVEQIGVARARRTMGDAALLLVVVDGAAELDDDALAVLAQTRARPRVVFFNKRDLGTAGYDGRPSPEGDALCGSALARDDVERVRMAVARLAGLGAEPDLARPHLASARQASAVARGLESLGEALATLDRGDPVDLIAVDLVAASAALGEIAGDAVTEEILGGIFARFCVGK